MPAWPDRAAVHELPAGGATPVRRCIAVLMAVYARDDPALFARALRSVLDQHLEREVQIRFYLGIDGPIAAALEAVIGANASRLHQIVRNPTSIGLAATLNRLIAARGSEAYFFRMDSDDYSLPHRFQSQLDFLAANPEIDIVGTDIVEVDTLAGTRRRVHFCDGPDHARRMICRRVPVAHPSVCMRAGVFDRVGGYPNRPGNEDIAMWFKCLRAGLRFGNVAEPLLEFSVAPTFWQRRGLDKSLGEFRAYTEGIHALWGWNWRLMFPFARLGLRLMPRTVKRVAYSLRR